MCRHNQEGSGDHPRRLQCERGRGDKSCHYRPRREGAARSDSRQRSKGVGYPAADNSAHRPNDGGMATRRLARVRDPVCGMDIDPAAAAGRSEFAGTTYSFCSVSCKQKFDGDPGRYLSGGAKPPSADHEPGSGTHYTCPMHPEIVRDGRAVPDLRHGAGADDGSRRGRPNPELDRHDPAVLGLPGPHGSACCSGDGGDDSRPARCFSISVGPGRCLDPARAGDARWSSGAAGRSSNAAGRRSSTAASTCSL